MMEEGQMERRAESAEILSTVQETHKMVTEIHTIMHGPSGEPQKGHVVRLDRVEQKQKWVWWAFGASVAAIVKAWWAGFGGE
jgi:hypothetical protein